MLATLPFGCVLAEGRAEWRVGTLRSWILSLKVLRTREFAKNFTRKLITFISAGIVSLAPFPMLRTCDTFGFQHPRCSAWVWQWTFVYRPEIPPTNPALSLVKPRWCLVTLVTGRFNVEDFDGHLSGWHSQSGLDLARLSGRSKAHGTLEGQQIWLKPRTVRFRFFVEFVLPCSSWDQEVFCQVRYQVLGEKNDGPSVLMLHGLLVNVSWLESSTEDQGLRPQWLWKMTFRLDDFFWFNCFWCLLAGSWIVFQIGSKHPEHERSSKMEMQMCHRQNHYFKDIYIYIYIYPLISHCGMDDHTADKPIYYVSTMAQMKVCTSGSLEHVGAGSGRPLATESSASGRGATVEPRESLGPMGVRGTNPKDSNEM